MKLHIVLLTDLNALVLQSKFEEALSVMNPGVSDTSQAFLRAQILYFQGKFDQVESVCNQVIDHVGINDDPGLIIKIISLKILATTRVGNVAETEELLLRAEKILEIIRSNQPELLFRYQAIIDRSRTFYYWFNGDFNKAIELGEGALNYLNLEETPIEFLDVKSFLIKVYIDQLNIDLGMPLIEEVEVEAQRVEAYYYIADVLNSKGVFYHDHGRYDEALKVYHKSSKYFRKIGNHYGENVNNANIGLTLKRMGDFDQAIKQLKKNIQVEKEYGTTRNLALMQQNLGEIYLLQGEIDLAESNFQQGLKYSEHIKNPQLLGTIHYHMGKLEYSRKEFQKSIDHFKELKRIATEYNHARFLADAYLYLILVLLAQQKEEAEEELNKFRLLVENGTLKYYKNNYDLAYALFLKNTKRAINQSKALEVLQELQSKQELEFDHRYIILVSMIEILIFELQITKNDEVLIEIYNKVRDLSDLAVNCGSNRLILEIYLFEAKIALLEFNVKEAMRLVEKAINQSQELKISQLTDKAEAQKKEILSYIERWEKGLKFSEALSLIEEIKLKEYLTEISQVFRPGSASNE